MKSIFKKKAFLSIILAFSSPLVFALPGVKPYISDVSGQYVFYQDSSFSRESYIGIIYYDDSTYGLRYFAPEYGKDKNFEPAKNIALLVTVDETKDYVELTGERITTPLMPADTDLVNYLHDFLYEIASRRKKAGEINKNTRNPEIYDQFGGDVIVEYDPLVPVTNIRRIESSGKAVLDAVTAGQLASSLDSSFDSFRGLSPVTVAVKEQKSKKLKIKKAKAQAFSFENNGKTLSVSLDSNWEQKTENLWLLGNSAVLMVSSLPPLNEADFLSFERRLLLSSENVYSAWKNLSVKDSSENLKITQVFYDAEISGLKNDFKIVYKGGSSFFVSLTVKASSYESAGKYFDAVLKSISIK